jgi:Escherichia/Staphylococcus phage prohead protease
VTDYERRYTRGLVEIRAAADGDRPVIGGYAAKFDKLSQNLGGFVERIDSRFFNKSAGDGWPGVMARYNHDDNFLLGTTAGGTLQIRLDEIGLDYSVVPPSHRTDVLELVQRGDVHQSSFAFRVFEDDWSMTDDETALRTLVTGKLIDVAPVNTPAYLDTSSGLRSLAKWADAPLEEVRSMADAGDLRKFFGKPAPTVIDVSTMTSSDAETRDEETETQDDGQGNHPDSVLSQRRVEWLKKRR